MVRNVINPDGLINRPDKLINRPDVFFYFVYESFNSVPGKI